jgi:peptide/nickel transport system permease protein
MTAYLVRRLGSGVVLLLALTLVTFAVFALIPYSPARIVVGAQPSDAELAAASHRLGVDRPFLDQYGLFLWHLISRGDLGTTFTGYPVAKVIADGAPVTGAVLFGGAVILILLALPLAVVSALRPNSHLDRLILVISLFGIALQPFVVGLILRHTFGTTLALLPRGGYCPLHTSNGPQLNGSEVPLPPSGTFNPLTTVTTHTSCAGPSIWPWLSHLLLPWLTFALFLLPFYVRITRNRLLETLVEPFVLTARAKGASELRILTRHASRLVLGTTLAALAIDIGTGITAAIYIETIYGLPGLGQQALVALGTRPSIERGYDLPSMVGIVLVVAATVVILNIAADLATAWLNPRVRLGTPK